MKTKESRVAPAVTVADAVFPHQDHQDPQDCQDSPEMMADQESQAHPDRTHTPRRQVLRRAKAARLANHQ